MEHFANKFWNNPSERIEYYATNSFLELNRKYLELHQAIHKFFKDQQERWGKRNFQTSTSLIVYQVVAFQHLRKTTEWIEYAIFSLSLVPLILRESRKLLIASILLMLKDHDHTQPVENSIDVFHSCLLELQGTLNKYWGEGGIINQMVATYEGFVDFLKALRYLVVNIFRYVDPHCSPSDHKYAMYPSACAMREYCKTFHNEWYDKCVYQFTSLLENIDDYRPTYNCVLLFKPKYGDFSETKYYRQRFKQIDTYLMLHEGMKIACSKLNPCYAVNGENARYMFPDSSSFHDMISMVYKTYRTYLIEILKANDKTSMLAVDVYSSRSRIEEALTLFDKVLYYCYEVGHYIEKCKKMTSLNTKQLFIIFEKVDFMINYVVLTVGIYATWSRSTIGLTQRAKNDEESTLPLYGKYYTYCMNLALEGLKILDTLHLFDMSTQLSKPFLGVKVNGLQSLLTYYSVAEFEVDPLKSQMELYLTIKSVLPRMQSVTEAQAMVQLAIDSLKISITAKKQTAKYQSRGSDKFKQYRQTAIMQELISRACIHVLHLKSEEHQAIFDNRAQQIIAGNGLAKMEDEVMYQATSDALLKSWKNIYNLLSAASQTVFNVLQGGGQDDEIVFILDMDSIPVKHCQIEVWLALLSGYIGGTDTAFVKSANDAFKLWGPFLQKVHHNTKEKKADVATTMSLIQYYEEYMYWLDKACQVKLLIHHILSAERSVEMEKRIEEFISLGNKYIVDIVDKFHSFEDKVKQANTFMGRDLTTVEKRWKSNLTAEQTKMYQNAIQVDKKQVDQLILDISREGLMLCH